MTENEEKLYQIFAEIGIKEYTVHEHEAIFTSKEAEDKGLIMDGLNLKNLLMKDKKSGRFFLVILDDHRRMDTAHFKKVTGWGKTRFANEEEMLSVLGLTPGSVSPFGLICDEEKLVTVVLEEKIVKAAETELVNFHPNRNTATLSMTKKDFLRFLEYIGNPVIFEK